MASQDGLMSTNAHRTIPTLPITILQDLASIHHLISQDSSASELLGEKAAIETYCAVVWGMHESWNYLALARQNLGRPQLEGQNAVDAGKMEHGADCVYRNMGVELFEEVVERVKGIDFELGTILEACEGDYGCRFRRCERVREGR